MNKKLRKRKIKALMKMSMEYTSIPGESWDQYIEKLTHSIQKWNFSEEEKRENTLALSKIKDEYSKCFINSSGLKHSLKTKAEKEQMAFESYREVYLEKLIEYGKRSINPVNFLKIIKEEECGSWIASPDQETVSNFDLEKINYNLSCDLYKNILSNNYKSFSASNIKRMLGAGVTKFPKFKFICIDGHIYEVDKKINNKDKRLKHGMIKVDRNQSLAGAGKDEFLDLQDYILDNSEIHFKGKNGANSFVAKMENPEDQSFAMAWAEQNDPGILGITQAFEGFLINKLTDRNISYISSSNKYNPIRNSYIDISKVSNKDSTFFFKNDEKEIMIIMSKGNISLKLGEDLFSLCSDVMEWASVIFSIIGVVGGIAYPPVVAFSFIAGLVCYIIEMLCIYFESNMSYYLNKIDKEELELIGKKESDIINKIINIERDMKEVSKAQSSYYEEMGITTFFATLGSSMEALSSASPDARVKFALGLLSTCLSILDATIIDFKKEEESSTSDSMSEYMSDGWIEDTLSSFYSWCTSTYEQIKHQVEETQVAYEQ